MAKYRQIHTSFWNDGFVLDITPEEKYFYLYLMTNPKTTQCGIYELPVKVMMIETGYNSDTIQKFIQRFVDYKKILYHPDTQEIMLINWIKYNPPNNDNAKKCIYKELKEVKHIYFAGLYIKLSQDEGFELIVPPELEGAYKGLEGATKGLPSNKVISNKEEIKSNKQEVINEKQQPTKSAPSKIQYAEFVFMAESEYHKLIAKYGESNVQKMIEKLDNYKGAFGKRYKDDYRAILSWVADEIMKGQQGKKSNVDKALEIAKKYENGGDSGLW